MIIQVAQRQERAAEGKNESGQECSLAALPPAPGQKVCADARQRDVHDVEERISEVDGKKYDQQRVGIEEQKVGILQQRLTVVQIRVPIGQGAVSAHFLDEAGRGVGVIEDIAEEEHGRREDHLPEHRQRAERQDGRKQ